MGKEYIIGKMVLNTMGNGEKMKLKAMVLIHGKMGEYFKGNGLIIKCKGLEY